MAHLMRQNVTSPPPGVHSHQIELSSRPADGEVLGLTEGDAEGDTDGETDGDTDGLTDADGL